MVRCIEKENKAILLWRGNPMLVPLRHVRPHVGFVWLLQITENTSEEHKLLISELMDLVEDHVLGQVYTYGRQWNSSAQQFDTIPDDLASQPPKIYSRASTAAREILNIEMDGVQFGNGIRHS